MSILREYAGAPFVVQCNICLDTEELFGDTRPEAISDAKSRGYKILFSGRATQCAHCTRRAQAAARLAAEKEFFAAENRYEQYRSAA